MTGMKARYREAFKAKRAAQAATATPRRRRHAADTAMDRWARRYDALNGAPEGEEDR